jgi:non-canonical purine NTP pyrophosphatase, rdgB/HAM1 family
MRLFIGSGNPHKVDEIAAFLGDQVFVSSFRDYPPMQEPEETGDTLQENALLKAQHYFRLTGQPTLADDTGLEVEALNGEPGVYSARYAGPRSNAAENMQKLLDRLLGRTSRQAQFRTVLVYIGEDGATHFFEGVLRGFITQMPKGSQGFGYDPIFQPNHLEKTLAE